MNEVINRWRNQGRGSGAFKSDGKPAVADDVPIPLGSGEWDDPLGLPICVVCQNVSFVRASLYWHIPTVKP